MTEDAFGLYEASWHPSFPCGEAREQVPILGQETPGGVLQRGRWSRSGTQVLSWGTNPCAATRRGWFVGSQRVLGAASHPG